MQITNRAAVAAGDVVDLTDEKALTQRGPPVT